LCYSLHRGNVLRLVRNSTKRPILVAVILLAGRGTVTSEAVAGRLSRLGLSRKAVMMGLMRLAKHGDISRQRDKFAPLGTPQYLYRPNERSYSLLRYLNGRGRGVLRDETSSKRDPVMDFLFLRQFQRQTQRQNQGSSSDTIELAYAAGVSDERRNGSGRLETGRLIGRLEEGIEAKQVRDRIEAEHREELAAVQNELETALGSAVAPGNSLNWEDLIAVLRKAKAVHEKDAGEYWLIINELISQIVGLEKKVTQKNSEVEELSIELDGEKRERAFYEQMATLYTVHFARNPNRGGASSGSASGQMFPVKYREPFLHSGEVVTLPDGAKTFRTVITLATWAEGRLQFANPPRQEDQTELWNEVDWEPLKPTKGDTIRRLVSLEPVIVEGKVQHDEMGMPKYERVVGDFVFDGQQWKQQK